MADEPYACLRDRHLFGPGAKRLLSLDGGGVRGALSVAFLEQIEALLDEHTGRRVLLGDWFDLIGGTSTGAIIGGALALGYRASEIKDFYVRLAPNVFRRSWRRVPIVQAKFDAGALRNEIDGIVGKRLLGSPDLRTGFALVAKRIDTGSPWILANNPKSVFWEHSADGDIPNKDYPLSTLFRASTAAPTYFDPEFVPIKRNAPEDPLEKISGSTRWVPTPIRLLGTKLLALYGRLFPHLGPNPSTYGLFIDGGVTPYNNPAMLLLMLVSLKQFGICWELGPEKLTIVSVGTGDFRTKLSFDDLSNPLTWQITMAERAMLSAIGDGQKLALAQMQWLGDCPTRRMINSEIHGVEGNPPPGGPWFRFMRYDVDLSTTSHLQSIDHAEIIEAIYEIGRRAAKDQVKLEHLLGTSPVPSEVAPA